MKKYIEKYAVAWQHRNPGENLTKYTLVSEAAYPAFEKCLQSSRSTVVSGWKQSGLFPWCPENVNMRKLEPSKIYENDPGDVSSTAQSTPAAAAHDDLGATRMDNMSGLEVMRSNSDMMPGDMTLGAGDDNDILGSGGDLIGCDMMGRETYTPGVQLTMSAVTSPAKKAKYSNGK